MAKFNLDLAIVAVTESETKYFIYLKDVTWPLVVQSVLPIIWVLFWGWIGSGLGRIKRMLDFTVGWLDEPLCWLAIAQVWIKQALSGLGGELCKSLI